MGILFCARQLLKGFAGERARVPKVSSGGTGKRGWRGEGFGGMEGLERRVYLTGDSNVEHSSGTIFEASRTTATQLVITLQPDSFYGVGDYFNIAATAEDAAGNIVTNQLTVTVKIASGPDGAVVGGGTAVTSVNGVATFTNITLHTAGTYTLEVDEIGLAAGITQSFVEEPGEATQLVFSQAPTGGIAESAETSGGIVTAEDKFGNVAAFDEEPITLTLNGSGGNRTLTAQAVDGVADFSGDRLGVAGTYTLTASSADPTINSVTSGNITVTAGAAAKLGWGDEPTGTAVGRGVDLRVWVEDVDGNLVTTDTSSVTLSIKSGPAGAFASGNSYCGGRKRSRDIYE